MVIIIIEIISTTPTVRDNFKVIDEHFKFYQTSYFKFN